MGLNYFQKIRILVKSISIFTNWYYFPLVYFNLIKKPLITFQTRSGVSITIRTNSTDIMTLTNVWIVEEYSHSKINIENNDIIIDIGSHIGLFALYASQFCRNGKIYCFEPVSGNFELLKKNIQQNNINNIEIFNAAVSKNDTSIVMYLNKDDAAHSMYVPTTKSIKVNSTTLKKIFENNKLIHCNLLKLDCEGAEYEILNSLSDELLKKIKKMIIEYHLVVTKPQLSTLMFQSLIEKNFQIISNNIYEDMGFVYLTKN